MFSRCIRIRVFLHEPEKLPQTDGRHFISAFLNKGGGAPNDAKPDPASPQDAGAVICDRSPFGASPRLYAGISQSQLGLGRASWNRRMQTGGPSPTPVQQAPCSPITRRTGRCPDRLKAKVTSPALRNRSRSVGHVTGRCPSRRAGWLLFSDKSRHVKEFVFTTN